MIPGFAMMCAPSVAGGGGGGASDLYWANVVSLLHFDGADGSTTFTDETGRSWSVIGDAKISTAQSVFGGASGYFDGSGDGITTIGSSGFSYQTGDFTWECWIRIPSITAGNKYFLDHGSSEGTLFVSGTGKIGYYNAAVGAGNALHTGGTSSPLTIDTWYHVAASRDSGTTRLFLDGIMCASQADSYLYGPSKLTIGQYGGDGAYFNGHIDELRITKGVARYTANFTPPAAPFPDS